MKRSSMVYGAFAVLALGLFWLLAPGERTEGHLDWRTWRYRDNPELLAAATAWTAVRDTATIAEQEWQVADSRERALRTLPASGVREGFAVIGHAGVPASFVDGVEDVIRMEIGEIAGGRAQHPVVVQLLIDSVVHPVNPYRRAVVLPRVAGEPCNVLMRLSRNTQAWSERAGRERLLGTCGFYAAYGTPGAGMHAWLVETGMRTAAFVESPVPWVKATERLNPSGWLELSACRAGRLAGCAEVFNGSRGRFAWFWDERRDVLTSGVSVQSPQLFFNAYERLSRGLLGELARSLGPVTFAAVWQSAERPEQALQQVAGLSPAEWVQQQMVSSVSPYRAGPGIPRLPAAMAVLLFTVLTAWTLLRVKRAMT